MTFLDGLAIGFWLGVVVVCGLRWLGDHYLSPGWDGAPVPLDAFPKVDLSTYLRDTDPMESPPISADERRRILLAQARLSADVAEMDRVLTREESNEVDRMVGLRWDGGLP